MTARFVGRAAELATLVELLALAESGDRARGGVVAIVASRVREDRWSTWPPGHGRPCRARGREGGGAPPLWLW